MGDIVKTQPETNLLKKPVRYIQQAKEKVYYKVSPV